MKTGFETMLHHHHHYYYCIIIMQQNKDSAVQDKEKSDKTGDEKETSKQINSAPPRLQRVCNEFFIFADPYTCNL